MRYFSQKILIHRHWRREIPLSHWSAFEKAKDSVTFSSFRGNHRWDRKHLRIWFRSYDRSSSFHTRIFVIKFLFGVHTKHRCPKKKTFEFWCKPNNIVWRQHTRHSKDPQHAHLRSFVRSVDPLCAAFKTNRDLLPALYRSYVISHFSQYARNSIVPFQVPASGPEPNVGNNQR